MIGSSYFLLNEKVQHGIKDKLKWNSLTPIQEETIPCILNGDNCILIAQTAGGKTEAAFLPIISEIYEKKIDPISVIYISPIRALLNNQELRLKKLGEMVNISAFKWHGEVNYGSKKKFNIEPEHIIATTPESLEVMLMSNAYSSQKLFSNIRFIVIDEVHYFAENYRGSQLMSIIERIQEYSKYDIQRIGLSATIGNATEILHWISGSSNREKSVITSNKNRNKSKIFIRYFDDFDLNSIETLGRELKDRKTLFFSNSREHAEKVATLLKEKGLNTRVHHSSISKNLREISEEKLKNSSEEMVLCCTSTMELGIDVGELDTVMQLGCPSTVASFRQRMGRTGRREGTSSHYEFCVENKVDLIKSIAIVELARKKWIESINICTNSYTTLFQQIICLIQQKFGIKESDFISLVKSSKSFDNIDDDKLNNFINYLIENKYIENINGEYLIGSTTEKEYGYNLIMNFISVFESLPEYTVVYKSKNIGTLQSWFINTIMKDTNQFRFILAGTTWIVYKIDKDKHKIYVQKSKDAKLASWVGNGVTISYEISRKMLNILTSEEEYPYTDSKSAKELNSARIEHTSLDIREDNILIDIVKDGVDIYTYGGHKVNFTLGLIIKYEFGCEFSVLYDKLKLRKLDKSINEIHLVSLLNRLNGNKYEIEQMAEGAIINSNYESNSKFYDRLPRFAQVEVLKYELLDTDNLNTLIHDSKVIVERFYDS